MNPNFKNKFLLCVSLLALCLSLDSCRHSAAVHEEESALNTSSGKLSLEDLGSCMSAVVGVVVKGKINDAISRPICHIVLDKSPKSIEGVICGYAVGSLVNKFGTEHLKNAFCGILKQNLCVEVACNPKVAGFKVFDATVSTIHKFKSLNGRHYSKTCAKNGTDEWVDLLQGQVIGSGTKVCTQLLDVKPDNTEVPKSEAI